MSNQAEVSLSVSLESLNDVLRTADGVVTKVGEFLMDFSEEPDMSLLTPSMMNEPNSMNKDRLHPNKRPAQSMS